ncbi:unnamed protein product [Symbiodinium sp. CCMP2456]|nr:unnamed protein product [Symbiodinium sp. CCMP2456]
MCFMLLLMVWACLRCDDLQGICPESMTLSQLGLKFVLSRTKTSGPGKRVGQLQAFVLRSVSLSGYDWIAAGYNLLQTDEFKIPRDFLCLRFTLGWEVQSREFMDGEGVACHIRRALAELKAPRLVEGSWGLSKTVLLVPEALLGYVEEELFLQIQIWARAHAYTGPPIAALHKSLVWNREGFWSLQGKYPAISVDPVHLARAMAPGDASLQPNDEEPQAPYFVTVGRSGFRRLHLAHACAVRQERCVETIPLFAVTEDSADAICKLCAPKIKPGDVSSDSASSDAEVLVDPAQQGN